MDFEYKGSSRLVDFAQWRQIGEVNAQIKANKSPGKIASWCRLNGYKISEDLVREYIYLIRSYATRELYDTALMSLAAEDIVKAAFPKRPNKIKQPTDQGCYEIKNIDEDKPPEPIKRVPIIDYYADITEENSHKVKNEIEVLDKIIQKGWNNLCTMPDEEITPKLVMEAIALKDKVTDGIHMGLTLHGIEDLKQIEANKFKMVIEALLKYVPEEGQEEAIKKIEFVEDEYYSNTHYYRDFLRLKGLTEEEISRKLREKELKRTLPAKQQGAKKGRGA